MPGRVRVDVSPRSRDTRVVHVCVYMYIYYVYTPRGVYIKIYLYTIIIYYEYTIWTTTAYVHT